MMELVISVELVIDGDWLYLQISDSIGRGVISAVGEKKSVDCCVYICLHEVSV